MKQRQPYRSPLLLSPCTCAMAGGRLCLTCWRWVRHARTVKQRQQRRKGAR